MSVNWTELCRAKDIRVEKDGVDVTFTDQRRHRVFIMEEPQQYQLSAFVVRQAKVAELEDLHLDAWLRNRSSSLVGFRMDSRGRLVGEAWLPKAGLTKQEFEVYVRTLAAECDRLEFVLTGRDVE
jgi:hypothetical protein